MLNRSKCIFVFLCLLGMSFAQNQVRDSSPVVALVNGEPISAREFSLAVRRHRAAVFTQFHEKYGAEDSADFWTTSYKGQVPKEVLLKSALHESVTTKVEQILARREGLISDISYGTFLSNWNSENARRAELLQHGQPIYGPKQYSEEPYFYHVQRLLSMRVREALAQTELKVSETEAQQYYIHHRADVFRQVSFEEARSVAESRVRDQKYVELLQRLVNSAKVEVRFREYESTSIE